MCHCTLNRYDVETTPTGANRDDVETTPTDTNTQPDVEYSEYHQHPSVVRIVCLQYQSVCLCLSVCLSVCLFQYR